MFNSERYNDKDDNNKRIKNYSDKIKNRIHNKFSSSDIFEQNEFSMNFD